MKNSIEHFTMIFLRFIYHQPNGNMPQLERITIFTMELKPINFWHLILEHNCMSVTFRLLLDGFFCCCYHLELGMKQYFDWTVCTVFGQRNYIESQKASIEHFVVDHQGSVILSAKTRRV